MSENRIQFIVVNGKKILVEDFHGMQPGAEFDDLLEKAKFTIHQQPKKSVLALFDATNMHFNQDMVSSMKSFVSSNGEYVKAAAVIGIDGLISIALNGIVRATGRNFRTFATKNEALEWLRNQ